MSSWVGIESAPGSDPDLPATRVTGATLHGSVDSVPAASPSPVATRRVRRQQRPIIGSLDSAGALIQRNAREIVVGSAFIIIPGVVLNLIAASLAFDRYQRFSGSVVSVPELFGGARASSGIEQLLWFIGLILNTLGASLVGGYVATLAVRRQMGLPVSIRGGYRAMLPRSPALVIAWLLGHCWIPFGAALLARFRDSNVAPLAIVGVPLGLVAVTMTVVVAPAVVVERLGAVAGLRRGWRLARTRFSTLFGFVTASAIVGLVVQYGIAYLPRLLQGTGLVAFGRFGWLIEGVAGQLGRLISMPLVATATALVYLEMRMHLEGMDLVLDAQRSFGTPT